MATLFVLKTGCNSVIYGHNMVVNNIVRHCDYAHLVLPQQFICSISLTTYYEQIAPTTLIHSCVFRHLGQPISSCPKVESSL